MRIRPSPLSAIAASLLLAGCVNDPVTPVPQTAVIAPASGYVVTTPNSGVVMAAPPVAVVQAAPVMVVPQTTMVTAYRPGTGRVNLINRLPDASHHEGSAAPIRRLGITMDDGTAQWVDTRAQVAIGDRVELTADQRIHFPVATR